MIYSFYYLIWDKFYTIIIMKLNKVLKTRSELFKIEWKLKIVKKSLKIIFWDIIKILKAVRKKKKKFFYGKFKLKFNKKFSFIINNNILLFLRFEKILENILFFLDIFVDFLEIL
jgi:hypothetical protein